MLLFIWEPLLIFQEHTKLKKRKREKKSTLEYHINI